MPEIAAGYWWDPLYATGLGTSAFKLPEGNGHTSFDIVQSTVGQQPHALAENGQVQFRAGPANGSMRTAAAVQAGWTGSTYMGCWVRLPNASGDISGADTFFGHNPSATGQRRLICLGAAASPDTVSCTSSGDGAATGSNTWTSPFTGGDWHYLEIVFDTNLASPDRLALYVDLVLQTPTATASIPASLFDGNTFIGYGCRFANGATNTDATDVASFYYGNGIPSLANRKALRNRNRPVAASI